MTSFADTQLAYSGLGAIAWGILTSLYNGARAADRRTREAEILRVEASVKLRLPLSAATGKMRRRRRLQANSGAIRSRRPPGVNVRFYDR